MEVVLVVWVDVCPEVLAEGGGGDMVEESDEEEVEKEDRELVEEEVDMGSPGAVGKTGTNKTAHPNTRKAIQCMQSTAERNAQSRTSVELNKH